jgi:hypothetical protein
LRPYFSNSAWLPVGLGPPAQKVHLSILPRTPKVPCGELRRAERAGVAAVAAADADVLVVQHHAFVGAVEAVDRADRHAGRVAAVHAGHRDRRSPGTPSLSVTTRRRFTPQGTSCSFLQAVTQPLHSMQRSASQMNFIRAMCLLLAQAFDLQIVVLVSCIIVTLS